jgi:hypothetical protein
MSMKKISLGILGIMTLPLAWAFSQPVQARDDKYVLPIDAAVQSTAPRANPDGSVKFFFNKQETPQILARLGSAITHQRSRTHRSVDVKACQAAFLYALVALQKHATQLGANAVVNIASYYKNNELPSATDFECHAGAAAHVMLRGEFVKIDQ